VRFTIAMNQNGRTLAFICLPAKEEVLIRSFLNLARGDLPLDVVPVDSAEQADLIVIDSSVNDLPKWASSARIIAVGDQAPSWTADVHVGRPLQWSAFRLALDRVLGGTAEDSSTSMLATELHVERVESVYGEPASVQPSQVSDDIAQILERGIQLDQHDISELSSMFSGLSESLLNTESLLQHDRNYTEPIGSGLPVKLESLGNELEFWLDHTMVILEDELIFYVHPEEQLVYSALPEREWQELLSKSVLQKYTGQPSSDQLLHMTAYPIEHLLWWSSLARSKGYLDDGIESEQKFELRAWPLFDLIRFDNALIRMSTVLAREGHSVTSLIEHTRLRGKKVIAFMNACHQLGLLYRIPTA
jgi:hypothetical protein